MKIMFRYLRTIGLITSLFFHPSIIQFATAQDSLSKKTAYIARFKNDRQAAVVYSFDDGIKEQFDIAYPLLQKFKFTATFFIIPSQVPLNTRAGDTANQYATTRIARENIREMCDQGIEIANHSWSHSKNLTTIDDEKLKEEIEKADSAITAMTGKRPLTFAYPWNAFNARTQAFVLQHHLAAREFQFGVGPRFTSIQGNNWIDGLIERRTWGIAMIHAITKGFDAFGRPEELEQHFRYVKANEQKIWVTNFATLNKYIKERDSSILHTSFRNRSAIIRITSALPVDIYDEPLTVVLAIPGKVKTVRVRQGNRKYSGAVNEGKVLIEIKPDNFPIKVSWK